ncbi:Cna B-type domain-containing protein [Parvimonas micra]|uniref:Cna B-type domain-containing protein n=1 Tax=Parvimonas micra TaxID=33033 RepID=UPI0028E9B617|nr:Cna B-type domain-containing protein [Parvimonas micra]
MKENSNKRMLSLLLVFFMLLNLFVPIIGVHAENTYTNKDKNVEKTVTSSKTETDSNSIKKESIKEADDSNAEKSKKIKESDDSNSENGKSISEIDKLNTEKSKLGKEDKLKPEGLKSSSRLSDQIENLKVELKYKSQTQYYTIDQISTSIHIDASGITGEIDGMYMDIELPTKEYKNEGWSNSADKYVDNFSLPSLSEVKFIKKAEKINGSNSTIYRVHFNKIDSTTVLELPYIFSFTDGLVPSDYKLQPKVKFYNSQGTMIKELKDQEYTPKYPNYWSKKLIAGDAGNGQTVYGGLSNPNDKNRVSADKTEPVPFTFSFVKDPNTPRSTERKLDTIVIKDVLPTYENSKGETVRAKFDPSINPGWTDNHDGTISYTYKVTSQDSEHNKLNEKVILYLSFPDAKFKEGKQNISFKNKVEMTGIPYNKANNEKYESKSEIDFYITADDFSGMGILAKRVGWGQSSIPFDKYGLWSENVKYDVKIANKFSKPIKEIVLVEDAKDFDPRLYVRSIEGVFERAPAVKPLTEHVEIRAYKEDGGYDIFKPGDAVNSKTEAELADTANRVIHGEIPIENTKPAKVVYNKISIVIKDYELPPGGVIDFSVYMGFKDPFNLKYSDKKDILNTISLNAKRVLWDNTESNIQVKDSASTGFTPLKEEAGLHKGTINNNTGIEGEEVRFWITAELNKMSKGRYLKNPTMIDLLPEGLSATSDTTVSGVYNTQSLIQKWEIIKNYNNTGRDAIKIEFKSDLLANLQGGNDKKTDFNIVIEKVKINKNIISSKAETEDNNNDNEVYFSYGDSGFPEEVESAQKVKDILDINQNKRTDDFVLKSTSKVLGTVVDSIQSRKYIRSLEPDEGQTGLNYNRTFVDEITTKFSDDSGVSGRFQYKLSVRNYFNSDLRKLEIYDVLPNDKDNRDSKFRNILQSPVLIKLKGVDKTNDFNIYYRTDTYPSDNVQSEMSNDKWTLTPSNYNDVTAIKIVSKNGTVIPPYTILDIFLEMKAPLYNENLSGKSSVNNFKVKYNDGSDFGTSNNVENKLEERTKVVVSKEWEDDYKGSMVSSLDIPFAGKNLLDSYGIPIPAPVNSIEVELYADGVSTGIKKELNDRNGWKAVFDNLPVSKTLGGKPIEYTVKEVGGETGSIKIDGSWYKIVIEGSMKEGFKITNKKLPPLTPLIPPTRDIKVKKEWKDGKGNALDAPVEKIEVELYKDGTATGIKKELNKDNNWTATFEKLPVSATLGGTNHNYTVKEVGESGSAIQLNNKWYGVAYAGTMKDGFTITNKEKLPWTPMIPPTRDIKVTKEWKDIKGNIIEAPVEKIEVELYKDGVATGKKVELTKANNWTATFEKLEVADGLGSTNYYQYTVKEVGESGSAIQLNNKWYGVSYAGTMKDGLTITNKEKMPWTPMIPPTRDIKVTKEWKDIKGNIIEAPVEKIEVELYKDGVATGKKVELTKANNWTATFEKLEVADKLGSTNYYKYTVKEVGESENAIKFGSNSYNVSYSGSMKDGFTIINRKGEIPKPLNPSTKLPKTGSTSDLSLYTYCILTSVTLLGLIVYRRKNILSK